MVSRQSFRDAMARLGAAVNVVTTAGAAGRAGFTASAVCSVTDDPPTLLVCMNRGSATNLVFKQNSIACINTLSSDQERLSAVFAGQTGADGEARFDEGAWSSLVTGAPVLDGAVVSFDCRIAQVTEIGTHSVFFCAVEAIQTGSVHEGLIYFGRGYHRVAPVVSE